MSRKKEELHTPFEIGYLAGAVLGAGYILWKERDSKDDMKAVFKERLVELAEVLPELIDKWVDINADQRTKNNA